MEPAHQLPDEDRPAIEPDIRPHLSALEGGGDTSEPKRGHLSSVNRENEDEWKKHQGERGDLSDAGSAGGKAGLAASALAKAEEKWGQAGFYKNEDNDQSFRDRVRSRITLKLTRNRVIGGGAIGLLLGGGFLTITLISGPAQLLQLSSILQQNFNGQQHTEKIRSGKMLRYIKSGEPGETRVSGVGSKIFWRARQQLEDAGVKFTTNKFTGRPDIMEVDTNKLASQYPEVKGMNLEEFNNWAGDKLPMPPGSAFTEGAGGVFALDTSAMGVGELRLLTKSSLGFLDNGAVMTAIKGRAMTEFYGLPSLFHPIKRAGANLTQSYANKIAEQQAAKQQAQSEEPTLTSEEVAAEESVGNAFKSSAENTAKNVALFTGAMCTIRGAASDIIKVNRAAVVIPALAKAARFIALGEEIKDGKDVTAAQLGAEVDSFTDSKGDSIWTGRALQATADPAHPAGTDISPEFRQAFDKNTTVTNLDNTVGGGTAGKFACSPIGQLAQVFANIGIIASGFVDDGTSWSVALSRASVQFGKSIATKDGIKMLVGYAATTYFVQKEAVNLFKNSAVVPDVLSGAEGGNILAFGAREAANVVARSSGGIDLVGTAVSKVAVAPQDKTSLDPPPSMFARVFNIDDPHSLAGQFIAKQSPNPAQNFKNMASTFFNPGKLFSGLASLINPLAHADNTTPYDWGFDQYGIPSSLADGYIPGTKTYVQSLDDPYQNADAAAALLDSSDSGSWVARIKSCTGNNVTKVNGQWTVMTQSEVNPNSSDYIDAHCDDTNDVNWDHMLLFVSDSRTVEAIGCYSGADSSSCGNSGYGGSNSSSSSSGTGGYQNPLRDVKNIGPSRIDEGVDYTGDGPVYALGNGTVDYANTHDAWPGGNYISYTLSDGPAAGKSVYVAENCTGTTLAKGDQVTPSTVLCTMHNSYPFIEMGWSQGGNDLPMSHDVYTEGAQTAFGINFDKMMQGLGAPAASPAASGNGVGNLPSGWPSW